MKIIVDAMGGDNAPSAIVEGSIAAVNEYNINIILVGDKEAIEKELSKFKYDSSKIEIVHTTEKITNNEHPAMAIRKKKDSSMVVGMKMVKEGFGDAFISAGSTGALLTGATLIVGRIKGILRPAIAPVIPGKNGIYMIIDAGANVDCKAENLVQFAIMGSIYFKQIQKISNPRVALINNGAEEEKGNELTKSAHVMLKNEGSINFIGNIEPRDIPSCNAEVLVCDGFVGNTILKLFEGAVSFVFDVLKEEFMSSIKSKFAALLLKPSFKKIKKKFDYTEHGGAAFLGVNGVVIKAHGSSDAKAIKNAVRQAKNFIENDIVEQIKNNIKDSNNDILNQQNTD